MIARDADAGTLAERAVLMDLAGNAWLAAGQFELAEKTFSASLKLSPRNATLWLDRSRARGAKKQWAAAEDDLNHAVAFDVTRADVYVARAKVRTSRNNKDGAKADIDKALSLNPLYPDALVERGQIRWQSGDKNGARADWRDALLYAKADSDAAAVAREYIQNAELSAVK